MFQRSGPLTRRSWWRAAVLGGTLMLLAGACVGPGSWPRRTPAVPLPSSTGTPAQPPATAPPVPQWQEVFRDDFDAPAGTPPDQWHAMPTSNGAIQNGQGQLDVGHLAQVRTNAGWVLPAGTQVRVSASLVMPDTGSNYAAFWVQHPNGVDPREIDVIESYGPLKPAGAQLGSHICYDEMVGVGTDACEVSGRAPELWPVSHAFSAGAEPWSAYWQYSADFAIGGDTVVYAASDSQGNRTYDFPSLPDTRRVPGNAVPFHLRLSNKDVEPQHAVAGGQRHSMLVDWVRVEVKYPSAAG